MISESLTASDFLMDSYRSNKSSRTIISLSGGNYDLLTTSDFKDHYDYKPKKKKKKKVKKRKRRGSMYKKLKKRKKKKKAKGVNLSVALFSYNGVRAIKCGE